MSSSFSIFLHSKGTKNNGKKTTTKISGNRRMRMLTIDEYDWSANLLNFNIYGKMHGKERCKRRTKQRKTERQRAGIFFPIDLNNKVLTCALTHFTCIRLIYTVFT